jgi:hypothetical protein
MYALPSFVLCLSLSLWVSLLLRRKNLETQREKELEQAASQKQNREPTKQLLFHSLENKYHRSPWPLT